MSTVEMLDTVTGAYYIIPMSQVQHITFELMEMDHGVDVLIRVANAWRTFSFCMGSYPNREAAKDGRANVQMRLTMALMNETDLELADADGHPCFWIQFLEGWH